LILCIVIATYVAFPHRGHTVPSAAWLGQAMHRAKQSAPLLTEAEKLALRR